MYIDIERATDADRETEQGWTPGPWQVFKGDRCWHVASMDRTFETGCIMFAGGQGSGEANARLIAAAPAMHEAISTLLNAMEMQEGREREELHITQREARNIWDEAKRKARVALNLAALNPKN